MINGRFISSRAFLIVSCLGSVYMLVEALLQLNGKSICVSEGCKVAAQYSRYGDLSMVLLGLGTLAVLAVFAGMGMRTENEARERVINVVLIAALAAEGFLVGYQMLWLATICLFCLSAFGIFAALGILRVVAGHREVLAGFASLASLGALFFLILPPGGTSLPAEHKLILFYSTDCIHCTEIRKDLEAAQIEVDHVLVKNYAATLRGVGIEHVPTLLVNGPYEKRFLTGTDAIRNYIASCRADSPASGRPASSAISGPAGPPVFNMLGPPGTLEGLINQPPDEGLCKEDAKCD